MGCIYRGVQLIVTLSHQHATGASKCKKKTTKKTKTLFNWEIFSKHEQLSLSDISLELFLIQIVFKEPHLVILTIDWSWS